MNLNVSTWSIHNPIAVILLFILLTIAGIGGFLAMQVQNFPDIDFPIITVRAELPGPLRRRSKAMSRGRSKMRWPTYRRSSTSAAP